jgi:hypothetical protein
MINLLPHLRILLRRITCILLPPVLILIALSLLAAQLTELTTKNEILSLSSFIVLLSFSALAFNWCRVSPSFAPEKLLRLVYQAGIDLFLASLLALVATFFAWLKTTSSLVPSSLYPVLFVLHWLFLAISAFIFLLAILSILKAVKGINPAEPL